MKGAERIVALRKAGRKPAVLWLTDLRPVYALTVQYEPRDVPETSDLVFVVGLTVKVEGEDEALVRRWSEACLAAGAKRVISAVFSRVGAGRDTEFRTVSVRDSEGVMDREPAAA